MTASGWLGLAASPSFAVMAVVSALHGDRMAMLCGAMPGASPLGGMSAMYALMSLFHLSPWINLTGAWRRRTNLADQGGGTCIKAR